MAQTLIRVGIVGCGNAGRSIHLRILRSLHTARYRVTCCADAAQEKAVELAAAAGLRAAASPVSLMADPEVDLVVIATRPPRTHRDLALAAFAAGKHVVVEKPMAGTAAECDEMIAAAAAAKRLLAVHHNRRWDADFLAVRHALDSGIFGEVRLVRNEYTTGFAGSPYDWGIHIIDQTMALSRGKRFVELTAAFCAPHPDRPADSEGFFTGRLRTEDGVLHDVGMLPVFNGNAFRPGRLPWRFLVVGERGVLYQEWCQRPEDALAKQSHFQPAAPGTALADLPLIASGLAIPDFYGALYEAIRGGGHPPVSGAEGRRAVRAWELLCEAACRGTTLSIDL